MILTLITFLPAAGGLLLLLFNRTSIKTVRTAALIIALVTDVLSLPLA